MLIDKLICGAYIEARSCERFAALAPWLDDDLQKFYLSLLRSEARHYQDYLDLAQKIAGEDIRAGTPARRGGSGADPPSGGRVPLSQRRAGGGVSPRYSAPVAPVATNTGSFSSHGER
jgi:tRNA-(ms[2]io[6]A)-hydroxylase